MKFNLWMSLFQNKVKKWVFKIKIRPGAKMTPNFASPKHDLFDFEK